MFYKNEFNINKILVLLKKKKIIILQILWNIYTRIFLKKNVFFPKYLHTCN